MIYSPYPLLRYLYRLFVEKFAVSPKQHILDSKLRIAKDMLLSTDMTVTENK